MQRYLLTSGFVSATLAFLVSFPVWGDEITSSPDSNKPPTAPVEGEEITSSPDANKPPTAPVEGEEITPPPDANKPPTAPTATRSGSNCSSQENPLTAIAPSGTLITTAADYPALLFYIPETTAKEAQFMVADKDGNFAYNATLTLPSKPGIMRLNLSPEAASPITETGNPYLWQLTLICDEFDRSADDLVSGELRRVEVTSEIENKLERAENSDRFSVFQEAGLSSDAIAALDQLRRENPQDLEIKALWEKWLRENDLEQLVEMPSLGNR